MSCASRFLAETDGKLKSHHRSRLAAITDAEADSTADGRRCVVAWEQRSVQVGEFLWGHRLLLKSNSTMENSKFVSLLLALILAHPASIVKEVPGNV